tara:strand:+ start:487 stop:936 length:450 start_codon:yes stop_codon:yes gene_type:complete
MFEARSSSRHRERAAAAPLSALAPVPLTAKISSSGVTRIFICLRHFLVPAPALPPAAPLLHPYIKSVRGWEAVLPCEVPLAQLRRHKPLLAIFHEALKHGHVPLHHSGEVRVVNLGNVQAEEPLRREAAPADRALVRVPGTVVRLELAR